MTVIGTLEQKAAALERDAAAIRKLIEAAQELGEERVRGLLGPMLNGNGSQPAGTPETAEDAGTAPDGPRGREAVRLIVAERPGVWTLTDLRAEMRRREWFTSDKGVDVAVTRLVASGEARRVGKGRYEFFGPDREETLL